MMVNNSHHDRRSVRLQGWDYSNGGAYFVTICAYKRKCIFENAVVSSIIKEQWEELQHKFNCVELDEFVIMPNHVHYILWIKPADSTCRDNQKAGTRRGNQWAGASPAPTDGCPITVPTEERGTGQIMANSGKAHSRGNPIVNSGRGNPCGYPFAETTSDNQWAGARRDNQRAGASPAPTGGYPTSAPTLGDITGAFKSMVCVKYLQWIKQNNPQQTGKLWQRNYYERIIRSEEELNRIRLYIIENPLRWADDPENPANNSKK